MSLRIAATALAGTMMLSACAGTVEDTSGAEAVMHSRYVAMGSSMAAGPGLGETKPGTPERCMRTFANYPTVLAERLKLTLVDATCGGATTDHILGPWNELPAQIDAVTPDTGLVTVTIGGNDLNYVGGLMTASCGESGKMNIGGRTISCPPQHPPTEGDYAKVNANLREIARQVKERAPKARLVFVEYLRLLPDELCDQTPMSLEDASESRAIAARLARINRAVAQESGAALVPVHDWSASNTACDAQPYTIANPPNFQFSGDGIPWHPNQAGMAAVANWIVDVLER